MSDRNGDFSAHAAHVGTEVEQLVKEGHTVRAIFALRALLDETGFWDLNVVYSDSVRCFEERGISESELRITLRS